MLYSTAFNSLPFLSGGPDIQTGLYTLNFPFGEVSSPYGSSLSFSLTLRFSPLSTLKGSSELLGKGWSFNLPMCDFSAKKITLLDGRTFSFEQVTSAKETLWKFTNHKLNDIKLTRFYDSKDTSKPRMRLQYKDRNELILNTYNNPNTGDEKELFTYQGEDGRKLHFHGKYLNYEWRFLKITDDNETILLEIDYGDFNNNSIRTVQVTLYPNTNGERSFFLDIAKQTNFLKKIYTEQENLEYLLDYTPLNDRYYITELKKPSGVIEEMEYDLETKIPGSDFLYLSILSKYTRQYGINNKLVQTFEYDENHNFFGNGAGSVQEGKDLLEDLESEYFYTNSIIQGDSKITQTWNKFHQLKSIITTHDNGIHVIEKTIDYYSEDKGQEGLEMKNQPDRFELPKEEKTIFIEYDSNTPNKIINQSEEFIKTFEFDTFGNQLKNQEISGVVTISEYYQEGDQPAEGLFPTHPFGMIDKIKKHTTTTVENPSISKEIFYYYDSIPMFTETTKKQYLLLKSVYSDSSKEYQYFNHHTNSDTIHGKLKQITTTKSAFKTTESFTYQQDIENDLIKITKITTTHDNKYITEKKEKGIYFDLLLSETDADGRTHKYQYDTIGRLTSQTDLADSEFEVFKQFKYLANQDIEGSFFKGWSIEITEFPSNTVRQLCYDINQKEHFVFLNDDNGRLRKISEKQYNEQGFLLSEHFFDYRDDVRVCEVSKSYKYDNWAQMSHRIDEMTGSETQIVSSPFDKTIKTTHYNSSGEIVINPVIETYNNFLSVEKIERFTEEKYSNVYSQQTTDYDSLGRLILQMDSNKNTLQITEYDDYDRITDVILQDGTVLNFSFQDFSTVKLPKEITLKLDSGDIILGNLNFDGLKRPTTSLINGVRKTFNYVDQPTDQQIISKPAQSINGRNQIVDTTYHTELNMINTIICETDSSINKSLEVASKSDDHLRFPIGAIKTIANEKGYTSYEYTSKGHLKKYIHHVEGKELIIEYNKLSLLGRPALILINYPDKTIETIQIIYDKSGRISNVNRENLFIVQEYDELGRKSKTSLFTDNTQNTLLQSKQVGYDIYGRPNTIKIDNDLQTISLTYLYSNNDKINSKKTSITTKLTASTISISEHYRYDKKSRLLEYIVADGYAPSLLSKDEKGNPITKQSFTYLENDSIATCQTTIEIGEVVHKTYQYNDKLKLETIEVNTNLSGYPIVTNFEYDGDGNLSNLSECYADDSIVSKKMDYNPLSKLKSFTIDNEDTILYAYDALDRIIQLGDTTRFYSTKSPLIDQNKEESTKYIRFFGETLLEVDSTSSKILGNDLSASTISILQDNVVNHHSYSPFGVGESMSKTGYNGQLQDRHLNGYHLGHGERIYNPAIANFHSMDRMSPFGKGGINPYLYTHGNPINYTDPSGNIVRFLAKLGLEFLVNFSLTLLSKKDVKMAFVVALENTAMSMLLGKLGKTIILLSKRIRSIRRFGLETDKIKPNYKLTKKEKASMFIGIEVFNNYVTPKIFQPLNERLDHKGIDEQNTGENETAGNSQTHSKEDILSVDRTHYNKSNFNHEYETEAMKMNERFLNQGEHGTNTNKDNAKSSQDRSNNRDKSHTKSGETEEIPNKVEAHATLKNNEYAIIITSSFSGID